MSSEKRIAKLKREAEKLRVAMHGYSKDSIAFGFDSTKEVLRMKNELADLEREIALLSVKKTNVRLYMNENHGHILEKQNLITTAKGDTYLCVNCGLKGKRKMLDILIVDGRQSNKAHKCPKAPIKQQPSKIKITYCTAQGHKFGNLKPNTIHEVITPPSGYNNDSRGVWVMGVGEPVKVLFNEYIEI